MESPLSALSEPQKPVLHATKGNSSPLSDFKLSSLVDPSVEALHDDNNNKHVFLAADQKDYLECKSLYGHLLNSHPISIDKPDQVKILVPGEMPDAAKSLANSASVTTMLNINGSAEETQANGSVQGLHSIYDYYKLPVVVDGVSKGITLITSDGKTVTDSALQEMVWSAVPVSVSAADVLQNATIVATSGSLTSSPNRHSDEEALSSTTSPINGHSSPQAGGKLNKNNHLIADTLVTNGDNQGQAILVAASEAQNGQAVLHQNEVHIKSEPIDPLPPLASPAQMVDVIPVDRGRDLEPSPPATVISLAPAQPYPPNATQLTFATPTYDLSGAGQYAVQVNAATVSPQYAAVTPTAAARSTNGGTVYLTTDYITYREYYPNTTNSNNIVVTNDQYHTVRQHLTAAPTAGATNAYSTNAGSDTETSFLDRYLRQQPVTSSAIAGTISATTATVSPAVAVASLPTNDSGIGDTTATPRPENAALPQIFDYTGLPAQAPTTLLPVTATTDLSAVAANSTPAQVANPVTVNSVANSPSVTPASATKSSNRRSWHEYGRNSDVDKVQIPKLLSDVGFKYFLESPISTSQRREDDRVTYINKGQFYGISLEYINDSDKPIKTATVKTLVMLVFREEKTHEEEVKAWQFWHSRQHSVKQRILDADTKNSSGIVGPIEEVAHNAIAFYWNPLDGQAKVNIAVQCLSTDFSNQKGVKGLPLHLQVDTFDDFREGSSPVHRGYCQIKVFCDKGAERKTRDEERRAAKRKMNATGNGRKKIEEMYHSTADRSEFYSMSDILKPPVLFTPNEDMEKITTGDINFYGHPADLGYDADTGAIPPISTNMPITTLHPCERDDPLGVCDLPMACPPKKIKLERYPDINERVLLFAKQENESHFHPLHLVPPTLVGLALAIENKYKLEAKNIRNIYKRCKKGITVQMDDDMVKHYSHEDTVLLEVHQIDTETHDITLVEYDPC